jgi:hypothetical protein
MASHAVFSRLLSKVTSDEPFTYVLNHAIR